MKKLFPGWMLGLASAATLASATSALASQTLAQNKPDNPWVTLSMMNPAGAAALGDAAATAQTPYGETNSQGPAGIPWAVWGVWLAVIALDVYLILKHGDDDDDDDVEVVTPA